MDIAVQSITSSSMEESSFSSWPLVSQLWNKCMSLLLTYSWTFRGARHCEVWVLWGGSGCILRKPPWAGCCYPPPQAIAHRGSKGQLHCCQMPSLHLGWQSGNQDRIRKAICLDEGLRTSTTAVHQPWQITQIFHNLSGHSHETLQTDCFDTNLHVLYNWYWWVRGTFTWAAGSRTVGTMHNEGKTPCPGNSDSAVQSLLCYLPRAIYSHKIFHSVRDIARKSPANPKDLQSYNNRWSTPSSTKGAQQSSWWPTSCVHLIPTQEEPGKIRVAAFSTSTAIQHCSGTAGWTVWATLMRLHSAGMRYYKIIRNFQSIHLFQWIKTKLGYQSLGEKGFCY